MSYIRMYNVLRAMGKFWGSTEREWILATQFGTIRMYVHVRITTPYVHSS